MTENSEVTAADIARIAGVGRAAVSNWRRRHADFPQPVGGPANSPTFALAEIEAWLNANGRDGAVNSTDSRRASAKGTEWPAAALARPMAALLPDLSRGVVFDPACGDGSLLAAAAIRLGAARSGSRIRFVGEDVGAVQVEMARAQLHEAGVGNSEVTVGTPDRGALAGTADAVISAPVAALSSPPPDEMSWEFGQPARADVSLAWVQIAYAYLKPGGIAVIAVPFAVAVRPSGRRIRAELLRAGVLTHVIALPENFVSGPPVTGPPGPWQIWILTRPVGRPTYVLRMVDLIDCPETDVPTDNQAWAAVFADDNRTHDVPSIELLDEDVFLIPAAHVTAEVRDVAPDYEALRDRYAEMVGRLPPVPPELGIDLSHPSWPLVTLGELHRFGSATFIDRSDTRPGDVLVPAQSGRFDAIVANDHNDTIDMGTAIRCDPETLDPYFLACFLRSETNRRQAAGTLSGTFRLDVRRARVPRMPLSEQRRYGEAFRRLTEFAGAADEVALAATDAMRTAIYGLTTGVFAPPTESA